MSLLLREAIGDTIRRARTERRRTLRDVSSTARVSLGYLSEVERGRKEPSSELLAAICEALSLPLPDLLDDVADAMRPAPVVPVVPARLVPAGRRSAVVGDAGFDDELRSAVEEAMEGADAAGTDGAGGESGASLGAENALVPAERSEGEGDVLAETAPAAAEPTEDDDAVTVRLVPIATVGPLDGSVVCSAA